MIYIHRLLMLLVFLLYTEEIEGGGGRWLEGAAEFVGKSVVQQNRADEYSVVRAVVIDRYLAPASVCMLVMG